MQNATTVLLSSIILSASAAVAQAPSSGSAPTVYAAPPVSQSCPISLYAQRSNGLQVARIADAPPGALARPLPSRLEGRLDLSFKELDSPAIVAISGIAHGPTLSPRVENALTAHPGDISEPFHLGRLTPSGSLTRSELRTHTVSNTRWLELTRIDFADGTHWQPSPNSQCRATPNAFLLVDATAQ